VAEAAEVINTYPLPKLRRFLAKSRLGPMRPRHTTSGASVPS
jgi:hypothetical protein